VLFRSQDAQTVFETHDAVCEGYARLFHALADEVGLESRYLVGDARDAGDPADGEPHAWNAIEIEGAWYLVDATWDAGTVEGPTFTPRYSTLYFLTPPDVFVADHFPDNRAWQLRPQPISRGEFHRAPILSPRFRAQGFELRAPDRSQVEIEGAFEATVVRPAGMFLIASYGAHGATGRGAGERCAVSGDRELLVRCEIPGPGTWDVLLFSNTEEYGTYGSIGSFQAVRR
jgi:transglutaminase/protease-like cytokinesis protein 3